MTTCEFKKECETAIVGKCTHPEWRIEEDDCPHRKFAILVVNKFGEKVKERLHLHIECEYSDNETEDSAFKNGMKWAIREIDQSLKMEED